MDHIRDISGQLGNGAVPQLLEVRNVTRTVFHVVSRDGEWHLVHHGRTLSSHASKELAMETARQRARERQPSRVVVLGEDGTLLDANPHDDTVPPSPLP